MYIYIYFDTDSIYIYQERITDLLWVPAYIYVTFVNCFKSSLFKMSRDPFPNLRSLWTDM